jgi:copper ion binding protein
MRRQIDPVCGMEVEEFSGAVHHLHNDRTYYFCALSCKKQFERSPEEYLHNSAEPDKSQNSPALPVILTESYLENLAKLELPISGMSCASCVSRIEKGLSKIQGVSDAKVNFAAEKATIAYDSSDVGPSDLVQAVKDLGYKTKIQKAVLSVRGMSCASCVNRVQKALNDGPGVMEATVNFATEKATVEYNSGQ